MRLAAALAGACLAAGAAHAQAPTPPDLVSHTEFRVCADPHNLPFSNEAQEGYENKVAQLLAKDLGETISYTWFPDSQGFIRATLSRHRCDVVMGAVAGEEAVDTTSPYYHTGYVLVSRTADNIKATALNSPDLQGARFGLIAATPPTDLLIKHNLMARTRIYDLVVDTRVSQPAHDMLTDIVDKKIDVGLVWGPFAGYYIKHDHLPLKAVFLDPEDSKVRLDYRIAIGVRPSDTAFRRRLNQSVVKNAKPITDILLSYGIPLLDEQNHPVPPVTTQ